MKPNKLMLIAFGLINMMSALSLLAQEHSENVFIIPQPNKVEVLSGHFTFSDSTELVVTNFDQQVIAKWFSDEVKKQIGLDVLMVAKANGTNAIVFHEKKCLNDEGYQLKVVKDQVEIIASSQAGYFYALQSFLQLIPVSPEGTKVSEINIKQLKITDEPRFQWRGISIDIARHFYGLDFLKDLVDQMAAQKMNRLHLHLSDNQGWRIEIKEYPNLHQIGGRGDYSNPHGPAMFLSESEARELAAYAKERQIVIIPEVDMPGHAGAISRAYPQFDGGQNTLNVSSEEAMKMVETVIHKLTDIFGTPYFHFGSDEVWGNSWEKRDDTKAKMNALGFSSQKELEAWFDCKLADFIHASGYIPVAWDEAAEFGVNKHTIIQNWRWKDTNVSTEALNHGSKLILSPSNFLYFDYPEHVDEAGAYWKGIINGANSVELIYNWNPILESFDDSKLDQILGIEAAVWTEFIANKKRLEYMIYPRLLAVAEKAWSNEGNSNWVFFQKKMEVQFNRYDKAKINYRIPAMGIEKRKELQPEAFQGPLPSEKSKYLQ